MFYKVYLLFSLSHVFIIHKVCALYRHVYNGEMIFQPPQKTMFSVGKPPKQTLWLSDTPVTLACPKSEFLKILSVNPSQELSNTQLDHLQNYVFVSCNNKPFCKLNDPAIQANIFTPLSQPLSVNVTSFCQVKNFRDSTLSKQKSLLISGNDKSFFKTRPLSPYNQLEKMSNTFLVRFIFACGKGTAHALLTLNHFENSFQILPCLGASCHSLQQMTNVSSNQAKKSCLQNAECSFILNDTMVHLCSDTSVSLSKRDKGSRLLIKGSKVLQNLKEPLAYYIYLNHQAICADGHIISEHTGIGSVKESIDLCDATPFCAYFTMTVESGLPSAQHPCGPLPNHVWLCKEVQQKELLTVHDTPLTCVALYGTISGYKKHFIETYGEPLTLAMTNEF